MNKSSQISGFKPTSLLTEVEIATTRQILEGRQPFSLYFNAAIKDLEKGLDNRWFYLNDNRGIIMVIDFDDLRVFSVIGPVCKDVLEIIATNALRSEFHVQEDIAAILCNLEAGRLLRQNTLKYYLLKRTEPFEIEQSNIRRLTPSQSSLVKRFYEENYDGSIFSDWMLEMPFYGYFIGGKLAAAGGCVVIDDRDRAANIGNFLTQSRYRGQGLAKQVTKALLNDLLKAGISTFTLGTTEENIAAWRAYESVGFSLIEKRMELEFRAVDFK